MPDGTPMLMAVMEDPLILRVIEGQTARLRGGQALLLLVHREREIPILIPVPIICTFAELLQRLEGLKMSLDLRRLLAEAAMGESVPVVIYTQDGGATAFLTDAEKGDLNLDAQDE